MNTINPDTLNTMKGLVARFNSTDLTKVLRTNAIIFMQQQCKNAGLSKEHAAVVIQQISF